MTKRKSNRSEIDQIFLGRKPWLDANEKRIPTPILKLLAKSWDEKTWIEYLESFELPAKEKYVSAKMWAGITEKLSVNVFEFSQDPPDGDIQKDVGSSIKILPSIHRQVIRMTYWQNMSVRDIAKALGIPKSTVFDLMTEAQTTLRILLKFELGQFALNEGPENFKKEVKDDQEMSA